MILLRYLMIGALISPSVAGAHPIAQGLMQLNIENRSLILRMQVHAEQIFVANRFHVKANSNLEASLAEHATYIQEHLFVSTDGNPLQGKFEHWKRISVERIDYTFRFQLPVDVSHINLRQNLLNEIEYAPGNAWEATYQVIWEPGLEQPPHRYLLTGQNTIDVTLSKSDKKNYLLFFDYVGLGISHILEGTDHLLFISALVVGTRRFWDLFRIITAFTLAHSLTLSLSVLDYFRLSPSLVEPMIAASIVVVAFSNLFRLSPQHRRYRELAALFFGLFHGLGFSGGLLEVTGDQNRAQVIVSIIAFTLGVEFGHQVVIVPLYISLFTLRRLKCIPEIFNHALVRLGSSLILVGGLYFFWVAMNA